MSKQKPEAPEPSITAWTVVYVRYEDGPGGGYELRELSLPASVIEAHTTRQWAPELMAITSARLAGRVNASMTDPESAARDTF